MLTQYKTCNTIKTQEISCVKIKNEERRTKMKINKQKLQIAMANACLNMDDLAILADVSRISISKYLSGLRNPKPKTIGKIAKALKVPVENLIDVEGSE